jgi:hypothetical protein
MKEGYFLISGFPVHVNVTHEGQGVSEIETLQSVDLGQGVLLYPGVKGRVPSGMIKPSATTRINVVNTDRPGAVTGGVVGEKAL